MTEKEYLTAVKLYGKETADQLKEYAEKSNELGYAL